jgi:site-specific DNA-cytosine methylase
MANSESYRPNRELLPLSRDGDQPSYTIKTTPRRLLVNTDGCGSSNSRRANSVDSDIDKPMKTLRNNEPTIRTDKPEKIRSLTIQETLILQGFSPDYDLTAANTQKARWTMIGNAVVPAVAKAVIEGII